MAQEQRSKPLINWSFARANNKTFNLQQYANDSI